MQKDVIDEDIRRRAAVVGAVHLGGTKRQSVILPGEWQRKATWNPSCSMV